MQLTQLELKRKVLDTETLQVCGASGLLPCPPKGAPSLAWKAWGRLRLEATAAPGRQEGLVAQAPRPHPCPHSAFLSMAWSRLPAVAAGLRGTPGSSWCPKDACRRELSPSHSLMSCPPKSGPGRQWPVLGLEPPSPEMHAEGWDVRTGGHTQLQSSPHPPGTMSVLCTKAHTIPSDPEGCSPVCPMCVCDPALPDPPSPSPGPQRKVIQPLGSLQVVLRDEGSGAHCSAGTC